MLRQFVTIFATDDTGCLLLTEHPDGQYWLPHSAINPAEAVDDTLKNILSTCNAEATAPPTLHYRSQSVGATKWANYLYQVDIRMRTPITSGKIRLIALENLKGCAELRSDEILSERYLSRISEVKQSIAPRAPEFKAILEELGFDEVILQALVTAIIDEVWPCERYSKQSFESLTNELYGKKLLRSDEIFTRSVCQYDEEYADFESLSIILALLEPSQRNSGTRCRFIFDFYNRQSNGRLSSEELGELLQDLHAAEPRMVATVPDLNTLYRLVGHQEGAEMSISQFSNYVLSSAFPGAASILKAPRGVYQYVMYEALTAPSPTYSRNLEASGDGKRIPESGFEYSLTDWEVSMDGCSQSAAVCSWWDLTGDKSQDRIGGVHPRIGTHVDASYYPRRMLGLLKYYVEGDESKKAWSLGDRSVVDYYQAMMKICELAKPIFLNEKRMLELKSPAFIFGDMHGNYKNLLRFEKNLWPIGPQLSPCSFVFIGDFVDRSRGGFLLMAHILSCKLLAPDKFFLVRGDHGESTTCKRPRDECHEFYIETGTYGVQMFKQITDVFDHLPLAAIVDDKIFCVHGGFAEGLSLPFGVDAINLIQNPLSDVRKHPLVRQLLWVGSRSGENYVEESDDSLFLENKRRKLAQNFSRETLTKFLEGNRLSFVIRGHDPGFRVHEDERLLTAFTPLQGHLGPCPDTISVLVFRGEVRSLRFTTEAENEADAESKFREK